MTRIVIDTNILVSAILTPKGNPSKILKFVLEGKLNLIISPAILEETRQTIKFWLAAWKEKLISSYQATTILQI